MGRVWDTFVYGKQESPRWFSSEMMDPPRIPKVQDAPRLPFQSPKGSGRPAMGPTIPEFHKTHKEHAVTY